MGQMKKYSQFLKELPSKTVVFAFGRFNPPTTGHELLVKAVKKLAASNKAEHAIYASKTQDAKKNPLTVEKKVHYLNLMFPNTHFVAATPQERTFIEAVKSLNKTYKKLIMVAGSDRVPEYEKILAKYNGKEFNYDTIQVISAGERDPDADDATGMSASKMRSVAAKGDYAQFKQGLPSTMREIDGRRLMNDVRTGMGLETIKEQINLVKDNLREQYFRGEIFNIGDIVESNGQTYEIVKRGSNHLLLKEDSGKLVSKWLQDVSIAQELHLEESMIPEELTDKTLKPSDKIKVARIIATMLGTDNAEASANPEMLINTALRKVRNKALNPEALKILDKMLALATEVGIQYDATLKPSKLKEGVMQPNGTDQIPVTTDSPVVNTKSKFNIAKDRMSLKDFTKLSAMNSGKKLAESNDFEKSEENKRSADAAKKQGDMFAHHLHMADHHENLSQWHSQKGRHGEADKHAEKAEQHHEKAMGFKEEVELKEEHVVHVSDGSKYGDKPHPKDVDHVMSGVAKHGGEHDGNSDKGAFFKFKSHTDAKNFTDHVNRSPHKTVDAHLNEETQLDEISQKLAGNYYGAATKKHVDKVGIKPNMYDRIQKDMGKQRKAGVDRALDRVTGARKTNEESEIDIMPTTCSVCKDKKCSCQDTPGAVKALEPTFDPFFNEETDEVKTPVVDMSNFEGDYDHNMEGEEISDEDLDKMAEEINDIDDVMDVYEDDELAIVDDETGEEIPDGEDEKRLGEAALMEVLSRVERMRAKMRIKRSAAKRERSTKIALRTYSGTEKINKRARRLAIKLMKTRLLRGRDPSKVSIGEKERIERTIEKRKNVIGRLAMRLAPRVRKIEKARLSHTKFTQGAVAAPSF